MTRYGSTRTSDAQRGLRVGPAALALAAMALLVVGASLLFNEAPAALEIAQKPMSQAEWDAMNAKSAASMHEFRAEREQRRVDRERANTPGPDVYNDKDADKYKNAGTPGKVQKMLAKLAEGQEPEEGAGYGDGEDSEGDGKTPEQVQDAQVPDAYSEGDAETYKKAGTAGKVAKMKAKLEGGNGEDA